MGYAAIPWWLASCSACGEAGIIHGREEPTLTPTMDPTRIVRNPLLEQHLLAGCDRLCPFPTCFPVSRGQIKTLENTWRGKRKPGAVCATMLFPTHAGGISSRAVAASLCTGDAPVPVHLLPFPGHKRGPGVELGSIEAVEGSVTSGTSCTSSAVALEIPFFLAAPSLGFKQFYFVV